MQPVLLSSAAVQFLKPAEAARQDMLLCVEMLSWSAVDGILMLDDCFSDGRFAGLCQAGSSCAECSLIPHQPLRYNMSGSRSLTVPASNMDCFQQRTASLLL